MQRPKPRGKGLESACGELVAGSRSGAVAALATLFPKEKNLGLSTGGSDPQVLLPRLPEFCEMRGTARLIRDRHQSTDRRAENTHSNRRVKFQSLHEFRLQNTWLPRCSKPPFCVRRTL